MSKLGLQVFPPAGLPPPFSTHVGHWTLQGREAGDIPVMSVWGPWRLRVRISPSRQPWQKPLCSPYTLLPPSSHPACHCGWLCQGFLSLSQPGPHLSEQYPSLCLVCILPRLLAQQWGLPGQIVPLSCWLYILLRSPRESKRTS